MIKQKIFLSLSVFTLLVGCSNNVAPGMVREKTAVSLGLERHEFTLSNRQDNTADIQYDLNLKNGASYHCTMPFSFFFIHEPTCLDKNGNQLKKVETKKETF